MSDTDSKSGTATPANLCEHCGNPLERHPMTFKTRFGRLTCSGEGEDTAPTTTEKPIDAELGVRGEAEAVAMLIDIANDDWNRAHAEFPFLPQREYFRLRSAVLRNIAKLLPALRLRAAAAEQDTARINDLEAGVYQLECMGTTKRYFNAWAPGLDLFTTAGDMSLRDVMDIVRAPKA